MKVWKSVWMAVLAVSAFFLSSCGCFSGEKIHTFSLKDSGKVLSAGTGDLIAISLAANPTTGFQWKMANPPDGNILALAKEEFLPPENMEVAGKEGEYFLKFEVIGPGRTAINLVYVRPWERGKTPARYFQLLVYASGKPKSHISREEDFFLIPPPPEKNRKKQ